MNVPTKYPVMHSFMGGYSMSSFFLEQKKFPPNKIITHNFFYIPSSFKTVDRQRNGLSLLSKFSLCLMGQRSIPTELMMGNSETVVGV